MLKVGWTSFIFLTKNKLLIYNKLVNCERRTEFFWFLKKHLGTPNSGCLLRTPEYRGVFLNMLFHRKSYLLKAVSYINKINPYWKSPQYFIWKSYNDVRNILRLMFWRLSKFSLHGKWNKAWLLAINWYTRVASQVADRLKLESCEIRKYQYNLITS